MNPIQCRDRLASETCTTEGCSANRPQVSGMHSVRMPYLACDSCLGRKDGPQWSMPLTLA